MQQVNAILSRFTPLIKHRSRMLSVQWGSLAGISYMVTTNTGQPRSNKLQKKQEIPSKQKRPPTTDNGTRAAESSSWEAKQLWHKWTCSTNTLGILGVRG